MRWTFHTSRTSSWGFIWWLSVSKQFINSARINEKVGPELDLLQWKAWLSKSPALLFLLFLLGAQPSRNNTLGRCTLSSALASFCSLRVTTEMKGGKNKNKAHLCVSVNCTLSCSSPFFCCPPPGYGCLLREPTLVCSRTTCSHEMSVLLRRFLSFSVKSQLLHGTIM